MRVAGIGGVLALLLVSLASCATNPATGARQFNLMSVEQEIELGREADADISRQMGLSDNAELQSYVSGLGRDMAEESEWPDLPWTFKVIDDDTVNAFALPGGHVYVTRGILAHFNSEAQLAGVLGHEIGHVTGRHGSTRMSRAQMAELGIGLAVVLQPELERFAPLAGTGMQLLFLSFSRSHEHEADELGVRYMANLGYDPEALIGVMETLRRVSDAGGSGRLPEWLSTHPYPENRQDEIRSAINALGEQSYRDDGRNEYLERLDGMLYGENPREGYVRGDVFYHPDLRFRFDLPSGWSVVNQRESVVAVDENSTTAVQLTISQEDSADSASRQFFELEEVQADVSSRTSINGLPAVTGEFSVQTGEGSLDGQAAFIEYDGAVYQIIGYGDSTEWGTHRGRVNRSIESFRELTDPDALAVEPMRLRVVENDRSSTLAEFYDGYYAEEQPPVALEEIARLNQLQPESTVQAGMLVKMVSEGQAR